MVVEKCTLEHLDEIASLFDLYRVFYEQKSDIDLAKEFIRERLENSDSIIFIAKNPHGNYVGFTQLYPSFSSVSAKRIWILNDLFVVKSDRGKGVAKALMEAANKLALQTNAKGLSLQTAINNFSAQKLYESLGYEKDIKFCSYFLTTTP